MNMADNRLAFVGVIFVFMVRVTVSHAGTVALPYGADPQPIIDTYPAGTHYILAAGVHRGFELVLKEGDTLEGIEGAVMSGAELLVGWKYEAPYWVHDGPHSSVVPRYDASPLVDELRARYPHDLFVNDVPLLQKLNRDELIDSASWFYDYDADKVYIKVSPTNQRIELSGLCRFGLRTNATGVKVKNVKFEKYATVHQSGAVELGPAAIVENCIVLGSHSVGIRVTSNSTVKDSQFLWNGNAGFHNGGDSTLIERNEFAYNGWAGFKGDWSRGGLKVPSLSNSIIRRNYSHHNTGPGIWFDINAHNNICEENLCEFNTWEGILVEVSCHCVFRHNICRRNGLDPRDGLLWGAPFVIQNSKDTDVYENYFEASQSPGARAAGVTIVNQNRIDHLGGACGANHVAERNHIHDNVMILPGGGSHGLQYGTFGWETHADFLAASNSWEKNTYYTRYPHSHVFHWYLPGNLPSEMTSGFLTWAQWKNVGQDKDSQFVGKNAAFFNPANAELDALILATTGVSYKDLKQPFLPAAHSQQDTDLDSMPDWWEQFYGLDPLVNDASQDIDGDGIVNLSEYLMGTNPLSSDSDEDGLPDAWEFEKGTNPLSADGHLDLDSDMLTTLEEYESDMHPFQFNGLTGTLNSNVVSLWIKPGHTQNKDSSGILSRWDDWRTGASGFLTPVNNGPSFSPDLLTSYPALQFGPGNLRTSTALLDQNLTGWTLSMVIRPRVINVTNDSTALMGNSIYSVSGFRLSMEEGVLRFQSTQSQSPLDLSSHHSLTAGQAVVVTLYYDDVLKEGRIYINGKEQGRASGRIPGNGRALWLGKINGMAYHPADFVELLAFSKPLSHLERRETEAMLIAKYLNMGMGLADDDNDGMPNWWELEFGSGLSDPLADPDEDGLNNLVESENQTDPYRVDTDGDSLSDAFEMSRGLNPWWQDDLSADGDGDGLTLAQELEAGTDWTKMDTDGDGMEDGLEVANNLQPTIADGLLDYDFDGISNLAEINAGTNPVDWLDIDGDGMHDRWETQKGLLVGIEDGSLDPDLDSVTNFLEFIFSSDPMVASGDVAPSLATSTEGGQLYSYQYSLAAGAYYIIDASSSEDLENWVLIPNMKKVSSAIGTTGTWGVQIPVGDFPRFFRVGVSPR